MKHHAYYMAVWSGPDSYIKHCDVNEPGAMRFQDVQKLIILTLKEDCAEYQRGILRMRNLRAKDIKSTPGVRSYDQHR